MGYNPSILTLMSEWDLLVYDIGRHTILRVHALAGHYSSTAATHITVPRKDPSMRGFFK